jgi:hypothetical protein
MSMGIADTLTQSALGLLSFVLLIVWLRWGAYQKNKRVMGLARPRREVNARQETRLTSSRPSSFAADCLDKRSNKYAEELDMLRL